MRTWQTELAAVAVVLGGVVLWTRGGLTELVGACAVLAAFAHAQVSDRFAEREAVRSKPDVACWRWSRRYFLIKEVLWCVYFVMHQSTSALVGVGVFIAYPLWRAWWRKRHPVGIAHTLLTSPPQPERPTRSAFERNADEIRRLH